MPPNFFQKPETALKRAQELILVGKEADALDTLHDTIKARRHKHQWSQTHEAIMLKHVELCVSLRKPHVAKDALFQYKALTQQIAVKSLEVVIQHFLELAEQRTNEAQKTSIEKVEEIDDLDQADAPENLLLSAVSGAATQDRMDRTVLSPWLRFLWDSYRNCLELLRNNSQVEQLYHRIAKQSFAFCARYQRRTEFRKLCDILRQHLNQIQKHQHLNHVVKLSSAESLTLMQETRLCQLDTAIQMELWQEAYRSAEDVHGMMQLSKDKDKRMVKPASSVNYYDKLALVFWKAGNRLFHAAALLQKFIIYKDMKKSFTEEEARDQASRVLLATLSIPEGADQASDLTRHLDIEDQHFANIRLLSNLLRLPIAPTRSGILKEAARLNVPDVAAEPVRQVFRLLEKNFAPLRLASQVNNQLSVIEESLPDYAQYVDALRSVVATKTLKQVSLIYDTISWSRIRKVIPFFEDIELERFLVDVSKHRFVKAQLDHRAGVVRFGSSDATLAGGGDLEDADGFTGDDAQFGEQGLRTHLQLVYNKLKATVNILDAEKKHKADLSRVEKHANIYETHKNQDYERILLRRRKIETYKETSERVKAEKSQAALAEQQRREEARRAEEMKRLEQENQDIEKKRKIAAQKEVEEKVRIDQLNKLRQTAIYKVIVQERGEDVFQNMDPESVLREQRQRLDEERREQQARLQQQEKKFDHGVRAFHLEEMLERRVISERRHKEAPKLHEEFEKRRVETAIAEHEAQKQIYNNLEKIREDAINWIASVKESHKDEFAQRTEEWRAKLLAVKQSRLAERAEERRRKRREEWIKKKAEEERLRKEDEDRARQAQHEEQKRAGKERVRDSLRQMQDDESKAMQDSNWRSGPRSAPPPSASRPTTEQYKAILREIPAASSQADQDTSWRKGAQPVGPAPGSSDARQSQAYRPRPLQESEAPTRADFGTRRVERVERPPLPASNTPTESGGRWERGQVQRRTDEQPARRVDEPPKETPTDDGKPKPWRPRRELGGESGAPARNEPLPRGDRDRDGREAPHRDGREAPQQRDGREAPQQRDIRDRDRDRDRRGPMPARGKADTDTNWRR